MIWRIVLGSLCILFLLGGIAFEILRHVRRWQVVRRAHLWFFNWLALSALCGFVVLARANAYTAFVVPAGYFAYKVCVLAYEIMAEIWSFSLFDAPRDRLDEMNHMIGLRLLPTEEARIEDDERILPLLRIRRVDRAKARVIVADLAAYLAEHRVVSRTGLLATVMTVLILSGGMVFVVLEMVR
jgi:hypothetical protein